MGRRYYSLLLRSLISLRRMIYRSQGRNLLSGRRRNELYHTVGNRFVMMIIFIYFFFSPSTLSNLRSIRVTPVRKKGKREKKMRRKVEMPIIRDQKERAMTGCGGGGARGYRGGKSLLWWCVDCVCGGGGGTVWCFLVLRCSVAPCCFSFLSFFNFFFMCLFFIFSSSYCWCECLYH